MKIDIKYQKAIILLLLIIFSFGVGFILGSRFYEESPIIINCNENRNLSN